MHTYGKIGCCSFVVAVILHLCTTVFIYLYLRPVEVAHQEEKHTIGLHYITVSSFVLLAVSCLISRLLFQEQHFQVRNQCTKIAKNMFDFVLFNADCLEIIIAWNRSSIWNHNCIML